MAQMDYSLACLRLSLLCFVGFLIPYFIKGFISWSNHMTGSCTKMFLTTLRATMIPQTPIPTSNPILTSMPNIYLVSKNWIYYLIANYLLRKPTNNRTRQKIQLNLLKCIKVQNGSGTKLINWGSLRPSKWVYFV